MKEPSNTKLADLRRVCYSIRKFCGVPLHFRLFVGLRSQKISLSWQGAVYCRRNEVNEVGLFYCSLLLRLFCCLANEVKMKFLSMLRYVGILKLKRMAPLPLIQPARIKNSAFEIISVRHISRECPTSIGSGGIGNHHVNENAFVDV